MTQNYLHKTFISKQQAQIDRTVAQLKQIPKKDFLRSVAPAEREKLKFTLKATQSSSKELRLLDEAGIAIVDDPRRMKHRLTRLLTKQNSELNFRRRFL